VRLPRFGGARELWALPRCTLAAIHVLRALPPPQMGSPRKAGWTLIPVANDCTRAHRPGSTGSLAIERRNYHPVDCDARGVHAEYWLGPWAISEQALLSARGECDGASVYALTYPAAQSLCSLRPRARIWPAKSRPTCPFRASCRETSPQSFW